MKPRHRFSPRVVALVAILILGTLLFSGVRPASSPSADATSATLPSAFSLDALRSAQLANVADTEPGLNLAGAIDLGPATNESLTVLVSFPVQHESSLYAFLANLSNPSSPQYHHYLTEAQFDGQFGGSPTAYEAAVDYLQSFGVTYLETFADRLSLSFVASPAQVVQIFHTSIDRYSLGGRNYVAPTGSPELPTPLASSVSSVEGLSTYSAFLNHPESLASLVRVPPAGYAVPAQPLAGYLGPPTDGGVQFEYAPDFQVAYDEQSLFDDSSWPTNAVIATILWSGTNGTVNVGPFVPNDVYQFFNETIPEGEPHAHVYGVPQEGAPPPGISASYDTTGAYVENTLDLEMAGSTAPGASIYNVYGPAGTTADLDEAFGYILNPTGTPGLKNVSVISNSWGGEDGNDSTWYSDVMEAQARGISVLAASGDSGDNPLSPKNLGGPDEVEFPSAMAYDDYGVTAVGGTTVTLNPSSSSSGFLHLASQTAWYDASHKIGSTGGVSKVFPEPSWQLDTSANTVIEAVGAGDRGVPDIAAVANNTLVTLTVDGAQYEATNATHGGEFYYVAGTSVASPLEAGIVAEINHELGAHSNGPLGFLNPLLYSLANSEFAPLEDVGDTGYEATGSYSSPLPTLPLLDVTTGGNYVYEALPGYDLVTGWGSLDAYNYTMYFLDVHSAGVFGRLSGVEDNFTLSNLDVTSDGGSFNASIQQNFFLANSLGAPVYWIQNVIYIANVSGGWQMTYSGWVVYPFYGIYPALTVYEYNYPSPQMVHLPATLDVKTELEAPGGFDTQDVEFFVGAHVVSLPAPGAAYIIGTLAYHYSWQGVNYTNGPYPNNPTPGGLSPQFGLVGGPSGGLGVFQVPTSGKLSVMVEPYGTSVFEPAATESFGEDIDQTGETAENLDWSQATGNNWTLGISPGSETQGVLGYEAQSYSVSFSESGLPPGTTWSVTLAGVVKTSIGTTITFSESNGSYLYSIGDVSGWHQSTLSYSGTVHVAGAPVTEPTLLFVRVTYSLEFSETGLPGAGAWYVNFTSGPNGFSLPKGSAAAGSSISVDLFNGTYQYTVTTNDREFVAASPDGLIESAGTPSSVAVTFGPGYTVGFSEAGLPSSTTWSVTLGENLEGSVSAGLNFSEPNGTYPYTITDVSGWHESTLPYTGSVKVSGQNLTEPTLDFVEVTYAITFSESGLPSGSAWWVNLTGGPSFGSTTASLSFAEPNGTYDYTVATENPRYEAASGSGSIEVDGSAVNESASFVRSVFPVTFTEDGLPSGTNWSVSLGGTLESSTNSTITFDEANGTVEYAITGIPGWHESTIPYSGTLTVSGGPRQVPSLEFVEVTYATTFTETGLPAGIEWWVNLTDGPSLNSMSPSLAFVGPNGTYGYTVGTTDKEYDSAGRSVTVNGSGASESVTFSLVTYTITFAETGLPAGTDWSITLDGTMRSSVTTTISFAASNGTYPFSVGSVTGYKESPGSGSIRVGGSPLQRALAFTFVPAGSKFLGLPAEEGYALLGGVLVIAAIAIALAFARRHRGESPRDRLPPNER